MTQAAMRAKWAAARWTTATAVKQIEDIDAKIDALAAERANIDATILRAPLMLNLVHIIFDLLNGKTIKQ